MTRCVPLVLVILVALLGRAIVPVAGLHRRRSKQVGQLVKANLLGCHEVDTIFGMIINFRNSFIIDKLEVLAQTGVEGGGIRPWDRRRALRGEGSR